MEKENQIGNASPPRRRSARLSNKPVDQTELKDQTQPKKEPLPFIEYKGAIKYYTEMIDIAEASHTLTEWCHKQVDLEVIPMAFDMEWPFSFQTGPGKASVMQICLQEDICYIFQLTKLKKLPAALMALLKHPKVRLHGVNIKNDLRKLARDFPETNADVLIEKSIDLGTWCNQVCELGERWSLQRLIAYILKLSIDKNKKVRMSKWHVIPLDEDQLMYAAIDVYIGQVLYRELERREQAKKKNQEDFIEKNGEEAYKAVRALGETFLSAIPI